MRDEYLGRVATVFNEKIALHQIFHHYQVYEVEEATHTTQVSCLLPQHGSVDNKKSARYYNGENGEPSKVHCFKCTSTLTAFWLFFAVEKGKGLSTKEIIERALRIFEVTIDDTSKSIGDTSKSPTEQEPIDITDNLTLSESIKNFRLLKERDLDLFKKEIIKFVDGSI